MGFLSFCLPFVFVFLHMCTINCFHLIVNILYITTLVFFTYLWNSPDAGFHFWKGELQFSKFLKNTICIGLCKWKCTEKCFIPFSPLHFQPEFVPHTEFKGRPEDTKWNVLYHTALRNYAAISLQVPSILSILLGTHRLAMATFWRTFHHDGKIALAWCGWGVHALPPLLYLPSRAKLWCMLLLIGQIYTPHISPLPLYVLCGSTHPHPQDHKTVGFWRGVRLRVS